MSDSGKVDSQDKGGGSGLSPKAIGGIVIGVVALIFIFSNTAQIPLKFLWIEISAPGWLMLLILFAGGFVTGLLFGRRRYRKP